MVFIRRGLNEVRSAKEGWHISGQGKQNIEFIVVVK